MTCGLSAAEFWSSTVAQLCALLPTDDDPTQPADQGTAADLLAMAGL